MRPLFSGRDGDPSYVQKRLPFPPFHITTKNATNPRPAFVENRRLFLPSPRLLFPPSWKTSKWLMIGQASDINGRGPTSSTNEGSIRTCDHSFCFSPRVPSPPFSLHKRSLSAVRGLHFLNPTWLFFSSGSGVSITIPPERKVDGLPEPFTPPPDGPSPPPFQGPRKKTSLPLNWARKPPP